MSNVIRGGWGDKAEGPVDTGGEPPGGNGLEQRVGALEKAIPDIRERLVRVETKLDSIEKTMANKSDLETLKGSMSADLYKTINEQTWKFIGVSLSFSGLFAAIAFGLARFMR